MAISNKIWASQAKKAKPSYQWEAAKHPVPRGE